MCGLDCLRCGELHDLIFGLARFASIKYSKVLTETTRLSYMALTVLDRALTVLDVAWNVLDVAFTALDLAGCKRSSRKVEETLHDLLFGLARLASIKYSEFRSPPTSGTWPDNARLCPAWCWRSLPFDSFLSPPPPAGGEARRQGRSLTVLDVPGCITCSSG